MSFSYLYNTPLQQKNTSMKNVFIMVSIGLLSLNVFAYKYENLVLKIPNNLSQISSDYGVLDCIGSKVDKMKNDRINNLNFFRSNENEIEYYPEIFWEKVAVGKNLKIKSLKTYYPIGEDKTYIFWGNNNSYARFSKSDSSLVVDSSFVQLQLTCKKKVKNWN